MGKRIDNTTCHCLKMRRAAGNVIAFYDAVLAPSGVTVRQYSLLVAIGADEGLSTSALGEACELDRSTAVRSVRPLVASGLVEDRRPEGSRDSRLFLTGAGRATRDEAAALWGRAQRELEGRVGAERLAALEEALLAFQDL